MKTVLFLFISLLAAQSIAQDTLDELLKKHNKNSVPYITVQELAMPKTDAIILDAREPKEFEVSHIKNATLVGYDFFDIKKVTEKHTNNSNIIFPAIFNLELHLIFSANIISINRLSVCNNHIHFAP